MSTTWYAQLAAQNWTAVHQWNTAADGSASYGTPAPGDTCDLNGKTVNVDFITSLGGTINVQDTPGTGLLNFNTDITNTDTWVCSCNIQVIGGATDGATGYVTLTNLSLLGNSLYESEGTTQNVNIGLVDGSLCPTLTILGTLTFPTDFFLSLSLYITVYSDAALDLTATTFSGTGRNATLTVWNAFSARANANYTEYGCMPQLEPSAYAEYLTGSGAYTVSASPVYFADPSEVTLGIDRGDGTPGTRTDCPADEALTTAIYGSPYAYFTGTVSLPEETEVVAGVTFGDSDSLTGSYPTSATTAAAQLATDVAAVTATEAGITTATTILGVAGTLDMTTYVLKTDVVSPSYVVVGNNNYVGGSAGTYPTSDTTAAIQLASDSETIYNLRSAILNTAELLGVAGTYAAVAAANVVDGVTFGADSFLTGTYPTSAATAAAQLATDTAAVAGKQAGFPAETVILGVSGTMPMFTATELEQIRYRLGIDGTALVPTLAAPNLGSQIATVVIGPFLSGNTLCLTAGAAYSVADGTALMVPLPAGSPLHSADACSLAVASRLPATTTPLLTVAGTFVQQNSLWYAQFELTAAQTALLAGGAIEVQRTWDLVELLADGSEVPIYVASRAIVKSLLARN